MIELQEIGQRAEQVDVPLSFQSCMAGKVRGPFRPACFWVVPRVPWEPIGFHGFRRDMATSSHHSSDSFHMKIRSLIF